jgi:UPF0716 protein FxsA
MHFAVFFLFIGLPLVELALLIKLGQSIGFWGVMSVIVLTALLGLFILQTYGISVMRKASDALARGETGFAEMHDGAFVALAGVLLIFPGLLGDVIGLILLIPPLRHLIARWSVRALGGTVRVETVTRTTRRASSTEERAEAFGEPTGRSARPSSMGPRTGGPFATGPVIDGEYERIDEKKSEPRKDPRKD